MFENDIKTISNIYIMENNQKKTSTNNIGMSNKKLSNYEKALQHYGITGKTPNQVATWMRYTPTMKAVNRQTGITKSVNISRESSKYSIKVEEELIKRWKNDSQIQVQQSFTFYGKKVNNKTGKLQKIPFKILAEGTRANVKFNALELFRQRRLQIQADSVNVFEEIEFEGEDGEPIEIPKGVIVEDQRLESSVSGGQRKVGIKGAKRHMRMRNALAYFKFGDDNQEWDTKQGRCVFDYLIHTYKDVSGFKKTLGRGIEQAYEFLNELFKDTDNIDEKDPLTQGVSISQLEKFCDRFDINMYAYDKTDNLIEYYRCKKAIDRGLGGGRKSLVFVVYDDHFYPVEDEKERKSKSARAANTENFTSNDIETSSNKKEETKKTIIAPTKEEYEQLTKDNDDIISIQNKWILDYIKKNNNTIPFPISSKNIKVKEATIERMIYDDKIVLTKPIDPSIQKYYGDKYQGQNSLDVTYNIWDSMYPFTINKAPFLSQTNQQVAEVLNADNVKYRTHLGRINDNYSPETIRQLLQDNKAVAVDITKCYCDALYNQRDKFIVFNGKEVVEKYDGEPLTLGLYFVETDDMTLFHQSNWYSRTIIQLAEKEGIYFEIKRQIRCVDEDWDWKQLGTDDDGNEIVKRSLDNKTLFKDYIDKVIELTKQDEDFTITNEDDDAFNVTKLVINSLSGILGKTHTKIKQVGLSVSLNELWSDWLVPEVKSNPNYNPYFNEIKSGEDREDRVYLYGTELKTIGLSNGLPMYIQILDWSNEALYQLGKDIGGEIVYRKTDCIVSIGGIIPTDKLVNYPCYYTETFGKYHTEKLKKAINFNYELVMNTNRKVELPPLNDTWNTYDFKSSNEWEDIIRTAKERGGMLIRGRAGTGKSYIIHKGVETGLLPESPETRLAFTNRASRNIGGTTIHKSMAINSNDKTNSKTLQHLKSIGDVFIVDEISMINSFLWNKLMILKQVTGATFILIGDHRQCPPIEKGKEIDYFNHPYVKHLVNYNRCELTEPQRYDMKLWNWLEDLYEKGIEGDEVCKKKLNINNILYRKNICYLNNTRMNINRLCNNYLRQRDRRLYFIIPVPDGCKNEYADNVYIYKELPVMAVANNKDYEIINSEEFWVKDFSVVEDYIIMYRDENNDDTIKIKINDFHKYFVVNYAATTHKSQGATITKEINIFDWNMMTLDLRIAYTAVSRAKTCEQVTIFKGDYVSLDAE